MAAVACCRRCRILCVRSFLDELPRRVTAHPPLLPLGLPLELSIPCSRLTSREKCADRRDCTFSEGAMMCHANGWSSQPHQKRRFLPVHSSFCCVLGCRVHFSTSCHDRSCSPPSPPPHSLAPGKMPPCTRFHEERACTQNPACRFQEKLQICLARDARIPCNRLYDKETCAVRLGCAHPSPPPPSLPMLAGVVAVPSPLNLAGQAGGCEFYRNSCFPKGTHKPCKEYISNMAVGKGGPRPDDAAGWLRSTTPMLICSPHRSARRTCANGTKSCKCAKMTTYERSQLLAQAGPALLARSPFPKTMPPLTSRFPPLFPRHVPLPTSLALVAGAEQGRRRWRQAALGRP